MAAGNATAGNAAAAKAAAAKALARKFAIRARLNHQVMAGFAISLAAVAAIYIIFHSLRRITRARRLQQPSRKPSLAQNVSRRIRNVFVRKVPGLPSAGHGVIITAYVVINIVALFVNVDNGLFLLLPNYASRTGWLAVGNMLLLVFLALKNTPLAFLTAWSYERLNILHQVAGYSTIAFTVLHVSFYAKYFVATHRAAKLLDQNIIYGMVAALCFVLLGVGGAFVRRWWYELFYISHIVLWILAVIMVGLHQPDFGGKIVLVTCCAGGIWAVDRLVRLTRLLIYSTNNSVVLTPLSNGATRLTVKKAPFEAVSGKHCFLWIPQIRAGETHPFTIAAMDPMEFVVTSYDGFTSDLHKYAVANPGASLKVSVDGSYGTFPEPTDYDTVVLVAGGSGASFTFGMALNMLNALKQDEKKHVVFVWIVKHHSYLGWYSHHLETLRNDPRVTLQLYVTRSPQSGTTTPNSLTMTHTLLITNKEEKLSETVQAFHSKTSSISEDAEKGVHLGTDTSSTADDAEYLTHVHGIPINYKRPQIETLIKNEVEGTPNNSSILVMGCGPDGLMTQVRNTTAKCIRVDGPTVELHCEQFGW